MHLFSAPWRALPCHRGEGLAASAALHVAVFTLLPVLAAAPPVDGGPALVIADVAPDELAAPPQDDFAAGIATDASIEEAEADQTFAGASHLQVDGLDFDIEKIRRQRGTLFPFLTTPLSFLDDVRERYHATPGRLVNPFGRERRDRGRSALALGATALQQIVDRSWSRRDRWSNFAEIASLLAAHDPDTGDAAALVRAHVDQNLLQPYFDAPDRDPRFWVTLGLAADHAPFVSFVDGFMQQHPSSRVTTELLFMLDEFAQASRDALLMLLSSDPWQALDKTRAADPTAFALAEWLYVHYRDLAQRQGLDRTEAVRARFDVVRIRILTTILDSSPEGYGSNDARFLLGRIAWDHHDPDGAYEWWSGLDGDDGRGSYADASAALQRAMAAGGATGPAVASILGAEYRRWLTFSAARLDRFGYAFDTF